MAGSDRLYFEPSFLRALDAASPGQRTYITASNQEGLAGAFVFESAVLDGRDLGDYVPANAAEAKMAFPEPVVRFGRRRLEDIRWPVLYLGTPLAPQDPGFAFRHGLPEAECLLLLDQAFQQAQALFPDTRAELATGLATQLDGFYILDAEPDFSLSLDPSWRTIDDYLAALQSKYRVKARRVLKDAASLERRELDLSAIREQRASLYALYRQVSDRAGFNLALAGEAHFETMKASYGERYRLIAWYAPDNKEQPLGFHTALLGEASLSQTLRARFVGLDYAHAEQHKLYPRMLFDYLELAMTHGCQQIHFGRTAAESKSAIGALATNSPYGFRYRSPWLNPVIGYLLREARTPPWTQRHPFRDSAQTPASP